MVEMQSVLVLKLVSEKHCWAIPSEFCGGAALLMLPDLGEEQMCKASLASAILNVMGF